MIVTINYFQVVCNSCYASSGEMKTTIELALGCCAGMEWTHEIGRDLCPACAEKEAR